MRVEVRLFAFLRELAGTGSVEIDLAEGATVSDLLEAVRSLPGLSRMPGGTAVAVGREYAAPDRTLLDGDDVALIPPVAGG